MIDLKAARHNPEHFRAALSRQGAAENFDVLLEADRRWREPTERSENLRAEQRRSSKSSKGAPPSAEAIEKLRGLKADALPRLHPVEIAWLQQNSDLRDTPAGPASAAADHSPTAVRSLPQTRSSRR